MKRITIAWFSWDWTKLMGHRVVNISDDVLADSQATHRFIVALGRSVMPDVYVGEKQSVHAVLVEGAVSGEDLMASMDQLKAAHAARAVPFVESWE